MYLCRLEKMMKRHQELLIRTIRDSNCDIMDFGFLLHPQKRQN